MKDYKEIKEVLDDAENRELQMNENYHGDYLDGVIATLRWLIFNSEEPIERRN